MLKLIMLEFYCCERGGIQAKLEFSRFIGTEAHDWILKVEQFFSNGNTLNDEKVPITMEGQALSRYNWLQDSGPIQGWEAFVDALKVRFDLVGAYTKAQTNINCG
jgi:hypothetical protein